MYVPTLQGVIKIKKLNEIKRINKCFDKKIHRDLPLETLRKPYKKL